MDNILKLIKIKKNIKLNKEVDKSLGQIINAIISDYKKIENKYPLNIPTNKEIKNIEILNNFKEEYSNEIKDIFIYNFIYDFYTEIELYKKENNKYPNNIDNFSNSIQNSLINDLSLDNDTLKLIMTSIIISDLKTTSGNVKMRQLIKNELEKNEELFKKFIFMNLDKEQEYSDFQEIGEQIKKIVEKIEDDFLNKMEGGVHSDKSFSIGDKYKKFIKTIFPLYYNIGVKKRVLSKNEMEEYIKKMNKK